MKNQTIFPREWAAVLLILALMGAVLLGPWLRRLPEPLAQVATPYKHKKEVTLQIEGEVSRPGVYYLEKGALLREAIAEAGPLRSADLRRLKLDEPVKRSRRIEIRKYPEITIWVRASDEEERLTLRKGVRWCDLPDLLNRLELSGIKIFTRKKQLKDGDIVELPG